MKALEVQFSLEALRLMLKLPDDVRLTKVSQSYTELCDGRFSVLVEGENLPVIAHGQQIPWGSIILHTEWCNTEERTHLIRSEVVAG